jgi:hypothetical protein
LATLMAMTSDRQTKKYDCSKDRDPRIKERESARFGNYLFPLVAKADGRRPGREFLFFCSADCCSAT